MNERVFDDLESRNGQDRVDLPRGQFVLGRLYCKVFVKLFSKWCCVQKKT